MKTYEIEIKRTSYVVLTIEAENEEQAEEKAWQEIDRSADYGLSGDADWETVNIEEMGK
jgi:hypothetical protein